MDLSLLWSTRPAGATAADASDPAPRASRPPRAAALVIPHPGRTGLLLTTAPQDEPHAQDIALVIRRALQDLASHDEIRLVQALIDPQETLRARALARGGLECLATLEYLERPITSALAPRRTPLPAGYEILQWSPGDRAMLGELLRRTYIDTLDCPGLADMRENQDILDGHLQAGEHDPSLWFILWQGDMAVGALLLSPSCATDSVELVYLGLAPEARGRALGIALLEHGMRAIALRPERTLGLAVDARNTPATKLYARAGFVRVRRRDAWVSPLARRCAAPSAEGSVK